MSQNDKSTIENLLYNVEIEEFNKWAVNFQSKSKLSLNVSLWKPFDIADLFEVETGGDILPQEEEEGEIPVIGLGFGSNGYCMKIKENLKHPLYDKGKITVSGWAGGLKAYYQTNNFYVKGRLKICTPKFIMSPYIAWFICTIINMQDYKFSYGRKASGYKFLYLKISLPIKMENGNPVIDNNKKYSEFGYIPDFEFMENYIKELPYSIQL